MRKHFTEDDGHRLAADMLREIREHVAKRWEREGRAEEAEDCAWRKDRATVLRRYIANVGKDSALAHGFYAALSEYLGSHLNGVGVDPEYFAESTSTAS